MHSDQLTVLVRNHLIAEVFSRVPAQQIVMRREFVLRNKLRGCGANQIVISKICYLMNSLIYPKACTEDLVVQHISRETLVYDLASHHAHCLNETASFVWSKCDGNFSANQIARSAARHFGAQVDEEFVQLAFDQLAERQLLGNSALGGQKSTSRREVIKKIGLSTAVALPVIFTIVGTENVLGKSLSCSCITSSGCTGRNQCPSVTNCNQAGICAP